MIFDEIDIQYSEIDNYLSIQEFNAHAIRDDAKEFEYALKREHNDQAYFLFLFTKLERQIVSETQKLFNNRESISIDVSEKRAWKLLSQKRLELMERVSFLTSSGATDYGEVYKLKKKRDDIAHGNFASGINVAFLIPEFKRLSGILVA